MVDMTTVDFRTRLQGSAVDLDAGTFCEDTLGDLLAENGRLAARGYAHLGLTPLAFEVGDVRYSLAREGDTLVRRRGIDDDATVVTLSANDFSDLVQEVVTTLGLGMRGRVEMQRGTMDEFVAWEPVLRALIDARPVHEPGMVQLDLDLHQSFTLDDPREQIGAFLAEAGFVKIRGVFEPDEMSAIVDDLADAVAEARREDGQAWWARDGEGEWYAARILGFNEKSPALRKLMHDDRLAQLGRFTDDTYNAARPRQLRRRRRPHQADRSDGRHLRRPVAQGLLTGWSFVRLLRSHRGPVPHAGRPRERRARRGRGIAPRERAGRWRASRHGPAACRHFRLTPAT